MKEKTSENKELKGLLEAIIFCAVIDLLLLSVLFFYNDLSNSFLALAVPGAFIALLFSFVICLIASLVYATKVIKLTWKAFVPLFINVSTILGMIYMIKTKVGK